MIKNLDKDEEKTPLDNRSHPLADFDRKRVEVALTVPFIVAGFTLGLFLGVTIWPSGKQAGAFILTIACGIGGAVVGRLTIRFVKAAARAVRNAMKNRARPEPSPSIAVQRVPSPRKKPHAMIAMICGGIGAMSVFSMASGLAPASFGSIAITLLSFGGFAVSFILNRRR